VGKQKAKKVVKRGKKTRGRQAPPAACVCGFRRSLPPFAHLDGHVSVVQHKEGAPHHPRRPPRQHARPACGRGPRAGRLLRLVPRVGGGGGAARRRARVCAPMSGAHLLARRPCRLGSALGGNGRGSAVSRLGWWRRWRGRRRRRGGHFLCPACFLRARLDRQEKYIYHIKVCEREAETNTPLLHKKNTPVARSPKSLTSAARTQTPHTPPLPFFFFSLSLFCASFSTGPPP